MTRLARVPLPPAPTSPLLNVGFPPDITKLHGSYLTKEQTSELCPKK
jgi:hypothetical protein